jgi:hypothetical protein
MNHQPRREDQYTVTNESCELPDPDYNLLIKIHDDDSFRRFCCCDSATLREFAYEKRISRIIIMRGEYVRQGWWLSGPNKSLIRDRRQWKPSRGSSDINHVNRELDKCLFSLPPPIVVASRASSHTFFMTVSHVKQFSSLFTLYSPDRHTFAGFHRQQ